MNSENSNIKFIWNEDKNQKLINDPNRKVNFEKIVEAIENDRILDIFEHENQKEYAGQNVFIIDIDGYAYRVPFREIDDKVFLITAIPSRKMTKKYLKI
jgi:hypothetical protein